jgi:NADH:ubiquinone oxidoreductase subunit H
MENLPTQQEINDQYDRMNRKRLHDLDQMLSALGTLLAWIIIPIILIAGCPFVPLVWIWIHYSLGVLIWLIVDSLLTIGIIYAICSANSNYPPDTMPD